MSWKRFERGTMGRLLVVLAGAVIVTAACNTGVVNPPGGGGGQGGGTNDDGNVVLNEPLGFAGNLSGKVITTRSTKDSTVDASTQQDVPPDLDTENTQIVFEDIAGNALLDADGDPLPPVPVNPDGTFDASNLPVGVDFTVCVDQEMDGDCEQLSCVNIPSENGGPAGSIDNVEVDPLTTLVLAKLRELMALKGVQASELPISPVAVVARVVEAYKHLFEESGVDQTITLEDLLNSSPEAWAALFDELIPANAQQGVAIVEGNLSLTKAVEVEEIAAAAAEVFLRAGFPIIDQPGGLDLSFLGELDGVQSLSMSEFNKTQALDNPPPDGGPGGTPGAIDPERLAAFVDKLPPELAELFADGIPMPLPEDFLRSLTPELRMEFDQLVRGQLPPLPGAPVQTPQPNQPADTTAPQSVPGDRPETFIDPTVYFSLIAEPDRNFVNSEENEDAEIDDEADARPHLPLIGEFILLEMAKLKATGATITIGDLYEVLTSVESGMGLRLTYNVFDPHFAGPPLTVFETADGKGKAINLQRIFDRIRERGLTRITPEQREQIEAELRTVLAEMLDGTIAPKAEYLLDAILAEKVLSASDLSNRLRQLRAHLPFSRSGPSTFFVVADGDPFAQGLTPSAAGSSGSVSAITVDAVVSADGTVESVSYNDDGNGAHYLGFTPQTEQRGEVHLIVRAAGKPLQGPRGPVRLDMNNASLFGDVDGESFVDFVSEEGSFYPGLNVPVIRPDFRPGEEMDQTQPGAGPNQQIFVLATGLGREAEPVRVDYDPATGDVTYNAGGRFMLQFMPDSNQTGHFQLFNPNTGREARPEDPGTLFRPPLEKPENFEDIFNELDGDEQIDDLDDIEEILDEFKDDEPADTGEDTTGEEPDGTTELPPGDTMADGETPESQDGLDGTNADPNVAEADVPGEENPGDMPPALPPGEAIKIAVGEIAGLTIEPQSFRRVFGVEVPNEKYNADGDPFFDDVNGDGVQSADEPSFSFRPTLHDPSDWRSTDVPRYYRRAGSGEAITFEDVAFDSATPMTLDGEELVARRLVPRLNAFRFGRPNTAINLLTAFLRPEFFDGTHALTRETDLDIFAAVAVVNLIMDQVFNVETQVDPDGLGPQPREQMLIDAHPFIAPVEDPFHLLVRGMVQRSKPAGEQ